MFWFLAFFALVLPVLCKGEEDYSREWRALREIMKLEEDAHSEPVVAHYEKRVLTVLGAEPS